MWLCLYFGLVLMVVGMFVFWVAFGLVMFACWCWFCDLCMYFDWVLNNVMFVLWMGFVRHVCILVMF